MDLESAINVYTLNTYIEQHTHKKIIINKVNAYYKPLLFSIKWSILIYQSASVRPYLNDK